MTIFQVYSYPGTKHFIDVHFDLSINTWTKSKDIPCNTSMNTRYDEFLYRNLQEILISQFNCTVPFLPDYNVPKHSQNIYICKDPEKRKASYAKYDLLKRNNEIVYVKILAVQLPLILAYFLKIQNMTGIKHTWKYIYNPWRP